MHIQFLHLLTNIISLSLKEALRLHSDANKKNPVQQRGFFQE